MYAKKIKKSSVCDKDWMKRSCFRLYLQFLVRPSSALVTENMAIHNPSSCTQYNRITSIFRISGSIFYISYHLFSLIKFSYHLPMHYFGHMGYFVEICDVY